MPTPHSSPPSSPTGAAASSSAASLAARYAGLFGGSSGGTAGTDAAAVPPAAGTSSETATASTGSGAHDGELSYTGFVSVDLSSLFPGGVGDSIAGNEFEASASTRVDDFSYIDVNSAPSMLGTIDSTPLRSNKLTSSATGASSIPHKEPRMRNSPSSPRLRMELGRCFSTVFEI
jgi:hypothetical protein